MNDAHAFVGRQATEAVHLNYAMEVVPRLSETLNMPQRPDPMTITDAAGAVLFAGSIEADVPNKERTRP